MAKPTATQTRTANLVVAAIAAKDFGKAVDLITQFDVAESHIPLAAIRDVCDEAIGFDIQTEGRDLVDIMNHIDLARR